MQPPSDDKPKRILPLSELARAMHGATRPPLPPEFVAEGTGVEVETRASVPPKPRRQKATEADPPRSPKLVLGLGVVDAKDEVAPDLVRSGRLEMSTLAAAYHEEASKALAAVKADETRDRRPRFAEVMPAAVAALMLPPAKRRERPRSGAVTVMLSAVLSAALITGTAAATLHTLRSDRASGQAQSETVANASEPEAAKVETAPAVPVAASPLSQAPIAEQSTTNTKIPAAKQRTARADAPSPKKSAKRTSKRAAPVRIATREPKRPERVRDRGDRTEKKRRAPATAKSCDEYACLMDPSLSCCKESAAE